MRMSCNGCRVLRKGCSDHCAIRPCLQWIRSPDAQGNATIFLAKFYGRAGLINLISAGPDNVRPAIFRSLLYEACGRMLNPVYGSVGLLWSGNWQLCQTAVENVLRGMPIAQPPLPSSTSTPVVPPLKTCDIRHVARRGNDDDGGGEIHRVANSSRGQFKRHGARRSLARSGDSTAIELAFSWPSSNATVVDVWQAQPLNWAPAAKPSHQEEYYSASHVNNPVLETDSGTSVDDTVEVSHVSQSEPEESKEIDGRDEVGLDLALGLLPTAHQIIAPPSNVDNGQRHDHRVEPVKIELGIPSASRAR